MRFPVCLCALAACAIAHGQVSPVTDDVVNKALGLPPGSTVVVEQTRDGGTLEVTEEATGKGAALNASGEKIVSDFQSTAPNAAYGSASGGDTRAKSSIVGGANLWANPLLWVGVLCLLGSGVAVFFRLPLRACAITGGVGVGLIAAAIYPAMLLFIVGGVILALAGPYIYAEFKAKQGTQAKQALRSVAAGVDDFKQAAKDPSNPLAPPSAWEFLKARLASHVEGNEEAVIKSIRKQDDLT